MSLIPARIGHYAVKRQIGAGGMGAVYEAMQEQPRRVVALKLLRAGLTGRSALRRFEYESQLLARLRHPGIAQVYEAGTHETPTGPVPFFAMEYIPGAQTITHFASTKKLGTRERMVLLARVCDAVHHGHQKGIIHRDLKPGNILVDSAGDPKIIDFGVARATDSDMAVTTLQTDIGQLIGTLQYMSPEQCAADPHDIDVRSDVYALGVVLYELLCGRMPYDVSRSALSEATRMIREQPPSRLSTMDRTLRGDPETIVLKALEKDRERRYRSAADLADDIRRYINGDPISARPPSVTYQVRVFARRHRVLVGAIATILLVTSTAAVVSAAFAFQAVRARNDAREAEAKANEAKRAAESLRKRAEGEASNARFRLGTARARAIETDRLIESLSPMVRRGYDFASLVPPNVRADFPDAVVPDCTQWLLTKFPELFSPEPDIGPTRRDVSLRSLLRGFRQYSSDDPRRRSPLDWVKANADRIDEIVDLSKRAAFRFGSEYQTPDSSLLEIYRSSLSSQRALVRLLVLRAWVHHEERELSLAMDALCAARRIVREVSNYGSTLGGLVELDLRTEIDETYRSLVISSAERGEWSPDALAFLATDLVVPPFTWWMAREEPMVRQIIGEAFTRTSDEAPPRANPQFISALIRGGAIESDGTSAIPLTPSEAARCAKLDYKQTLDAFDETCSIYRSIDLLPVDEIDRADWSRLTHLCNENILIHTMVSASETMYLRRAEYVIDRDATIITGSIAAYRAANGVWPTSIQQALVGFPVQPQRRDYYGQDFVYRVENNRPVLYSVGPDRKDDGGLRSWKGKKNGGDFVHIAPAAHTAE